MGPTPRRMITWSLLLGSSLLAAEPARSQAFPVDIARTGLHRLEADPGTLVTVVFRVTNRSSQTRTLRGRAEPPAGWRLIAADGFFTLTPNATEARLVSVGIPAGASAGPYHVRYTVSDSAAPAAAGAVDSVAIDVRGVARIRLAPGDAPRFVLSGESFTATFLLTNEGNAPALVRLALHSTGGVRAYLDSPDVVVARHETRPVAVTVATEPESNRTRVAHLELTASSAAEPQVQLAARISVEVFPTAGTAAQRMHSMPARLTLKGSVQGDASQPIELAGAGTLTEGSTGRLDFLFRGPGTGISSFGERDEYRLSYHAPGFALQLGDQSYRLTPLTETGRFAFGAGLRVDLGPMRLGGFTNTDRWAPVTRDEHAAFASYRLYGESRVGVNVLEKRGVDRGRLWSARADFELPLGARVGGEWAYADGAAGRTTARSVNLVGRQRWGTYNLRYVEADPGYPTYLDGVSNRLGSLTLTPAAWLTLSGYHQRVSNTHTAGGATTVFRTATTRGGVGLARTVSIYYMRTERDGEAPSLLPFGVEDRLVLGLGWRFGRSAVRAFTDLAWTTDQLTNDRFTFRRHRLQVDLAASSALQSSASLEYSTGRSLAFTSPIERWTARLESSVWLPTGTALRLRASGTRHLIPTVRDWVVLDAEVVQQLAFGHELALRGHVLGFQQGTIPVLLVNYRVPLRIPIAPVRRGGKLVARVYDAETGQGRPNVVARLGDRAAVSDRQGRLLFRDLTPDTYYLYLDRSSTGIERVPVRELPLEVTVSGTEALRVEIGLVRAGHLMGRVRLLDFEEDVPLQERQQRMVETGGLRGVMLELRSDGLVRRQVSKGNGRFVFRGLPPGEWTLRVVGGALPEYHYFERDTVVITLEAGATQDVVLTVLPRRRQIQIVAREDVPLQPETPRAGEPPAAGGFFYTVGADDRGLMDIAQKVYGDAMLRAKLWAANVERLADPDLVERDAELWVPPKAPLTRDEIAVYDAYLTGIYQVTRYDYGGLSQIASMLYGDPELWPKLWVANRDRLADPDVVPIGTRLRVPRKAPLTPEEVAARDAYFARRPPRDAKP